MAPGGYYTNGTTVCTADGTPHLFHGVESTVQLEFDPRGEWDNQRASRRPDFAAMASWNANIVRIALNQDFWLSGSGLYASSYQMTVYQAVQDAEAAGLDVILDLHWSDQGNLGVTTSGKKQDSPTDSDQQQMADVNSQEFWLEVAQQYKNDGHVLFELYNEPNGISWSTWLNGGISPFTIVGMQQLYDTIRMTAGANNVVIAGGLEFAFDLSGVAENQIQGYNIMYATHPYKSNDSEGGVGLARSGLPRGQGHRAGHVATEFGDGSAACTGQWDSDLIAYSDKHAISWTAWAWWPGGCSFPSLLADWNYDPATSGMGATGPGAGAVVKAALMG